MGGRVLGRSRGAPPGRPWEPSALAASPIGLGVRLIGQAWRQWSLTPPSWGVVSSGKSGSHPPVFGGGVLPRALGSSHSGLSCRFTPSRPTFLRLPQPVLICKPIVAPFLPSPPCHPCSWLFPAPPGEGIWALQACPRTPEMHRKSRTGETLWSHQASVSSSVKWE